MTTQLTLTGLELKEQGIESLRYIARKIVLLPRFQLKVHANEETGCWDWHGSQTWDGYGDFAFRGRLPRAHRLTYEAVVGCIEIGKEIDHLCRNRLCVNPDHMEAVSHRENTLRGFGPTAQNARRTHCIHGHTLDNAYTSFNGRHRRCRTCVNARVRRRYWANPEKARALKRRSMARVKAKGDRDGTGNY